MRAMAAKRRKLTQGRLALYNVLRRPVRTAGLTVLSGILAFLLFAGVVLTVNFNEGLSRLGDRFGADLIVVPRGADEQVKGIILQGSPGFFYMDKETAQQVRGVAGVHQASAQFFLTSVAADCCDMPVELIGFDPKTDFTILPWLSESFDGELGEKEVIIGSDITPYNNGTVRFYDANYRVAAQLTATGTGLDQAVYGNWDTLMVIFRDARRLGLGNIPDRDPEKSISSVLVRVEAGEDTDIVAQRILAQVEGVSVVRTQSMLTQIAASLRHLSTFLYAFIVLFALTALFTLGIVFSVTAGERRREFAMLRTLGLTRRRLSTLILREAAIISGAGALLGTALGLIVVVPFSEVIGASLGLPELTPGGGQILFACALSLLITFLVGPLAACVSARRIAGEETYLTLREGE